MVKRWKQLGLVITIIMGLLACRLAYIQLLGHEDLGSAADIQQQITLEGADTRGMIYDRNGTPIAGGYQEYIYIIRESRCDGETLNALNSLNAQEVDNSGNEYRVFTSEEYSKTTGQRLIRNSGAYILEAARRYKSEQPAAHMIGYVNSKDNSGASGLELLYDEELSQVNKKVAAVADVQGNLLQGYGLKVTSEADGDPYVKSGIITTLDLGLQKEAEEILNEQDKAGAIVVAECKTGDILAAASTPGFDPTAIEEYMESDDGELVNKVTQGEYPPGSVFKIVVAAAALEKGISYDTEFICNGSVIINGHKVKCETGGNKGHGKITLSKAFADSCNCAFIQLGQMTGADRIISTAKKMGLGHTVLDGYPSEQEGNLMSQESAQGAAIANLSIGQGETLVTPLQVTRMTNIIANNGVDPGINITRDTVEKMEEESVISETTCYAIRKMMVLAAEEGTGKDMDLADSAGVKTGSAESTQAGVPVVHGWITGYVPAETPEYVITIFVEDGRSGRTSAAPVFEDLANYMEVQGMIGHEAGI